MSFTRIASSFSRSSAPPGAFDSAATAAIAAAADDRGEAVDHHTTRKYASFHVRGQRGCAAGGRLSELEEEIEACESLLDELEELAHSSPSPEESEGCRLLLRWGKTAKRLEDLAADALETGCSREVPGAMDVFERANRAIDRMAELSKCHGGALGLTKPSSPLRASIRKLSESHSGTPESPHDRGGGGGFGRAPALPGSSRSGMARGGSRFSRSPPQQCMALEHCVSEAIRLVATLFAVVACGCYEGLKEAAAAQPARRQRPERAAAGVAATGATAEGG